LNCLIIAAEREPRNLALQATFADINIAIDRILNKLGDNKTPWRQYQ